MLGFLFICILCLFLIGPLFLLHSEWERHFRLCFEEISHWFWYHRECLRVLTAVPIMAIPVFMLAGNLMDQGGMSKRIVDFASASIGFVKEVWRW